MFLFYVLLFSFFVLSKQGSPFDAAERGAGGRGDDELNNRRTGVVLAPEGQGGGDGSRAHERLGAQAEPGKSKQRASFRCCEALARRCRTLPLVESCTEAQ